MPERNPSNHACLAGVVTVVHFPQSVAPKVVYGADKTDIETDESIVIIRSLIFMICLFCIESVTCGNQLWVRGLT